MSSKQWVNMPNVIGAVCKCLEELVAQEQLKCMGAKVFQKYTHVFEPIPHVGYLPTDIYCRIKIKDAVKTISTRTYSSPQKYQEAWQALIQSHEDAGQIRPSNSEHASPSFLTPKVDSKVLLRWVNDYWVLNSNTCWNYNRPRASGRVFFCLHCLFSSCCLLSSAYCLSRSPTAFFVIHSHSTETFLFYYYYYIYSYIFTPTPQTLSPNRVRH